MQAIVMRDITYLIQKIYNKLKKGYKMENKIKVFIEEGNKAILKFEKYNIQTFACIGKNGVTTSKKEGDGKTPLGTFRIGLFLGTHKEKEVKEKTKLKYKQINKNMYWVDDSNSKYYNQLVDITKTEKDWNSAEHLIQYPIQYEYLIEIKTNPYNIPYKGSAIFLHCTNNKPTQGCIAIDKKQMEKLIENINNKTLIEILYIRKSV